MKYSAPRILTTKNAGITIQNGTDPNNKNAPVMDLAGGISTNPAYEADE
jgi:hypothetical protein